MFGDGALRRLGDEIEALPTSSRVLLVSTPGRAAVTEAARAALGLRAIAGFERAAQHVPAAIVSEALDLARDTRADSLLAVGGGSAIGLAKALAKETALPLAAVPTTYSGSEMTDIWGVTHDDGKRTGRDPRAAPRLVLYDPELTRTMPLHVTAASGMNAIAHSVEALYSPRGGPTASLLAGEGIRRMAAGLRTLAGNPADPGARREALYGAHLCGRALDMAEMGLHHRLCHALGGLLGLPHAATHAVALPHVVAYNASDAPIAMARVAESLAAPDATDSGARAGGAARGLWELNRVLGLPRTLADLGMEPGDVERVVERVTGEAFPNPAPVTPDGVRGILARALAGEPPD